MVSSRIDHSMGVSRFARAVGVASLGLLVYMSPVDSTHAASHCGPKGTVNKGGTCDCDKCSESVGASGDAHCAPKQKAPPECKGGPAPTCGVAGKPPCAPGGGGKIPGVVPLDYNNMISIKGGTFTAGSNDSKDYDAGPTHTVTLGDFKIDKYEVPVSEYAKCVAAKKCAEPPKDLETLVPVGTRCNWTSNRKAHPMNCVSFVEATAYCNFKSKRLPTEAEWEYTAKGGSKNNVYPWGTAEPTCKHANYTGGPNGVPGCGDGTSPIGTHLLGASAFGVHDLAGNVEEWTFDFWGTFSGNPPNSPNPFGSKTTTSGTRHSVKGGSWDLSGASDMHGVHREPVDENTRMNWLGFRCATGPTPVPAPEMFKSEPPPPPKPPPIPPPPPAPNVPPPSDLGAMIKVTGATFQMGSDADTLASPVHAVTLASYQIDKYEVSVAQYKQCVDKGQCAPPLLLQVSQNCNYNVPGRENHPVNCVEWSDAKRYCTAVGKRLPTEAEWELAARGPTNRPYPWGSNEPTCAYAAFSPGEKQKCAASTQVVGTHPLGASYFGVMDMGGNVEEWVYDFFDEYTGGPANNPQGPTTGNEYGEHSVRGGNFNADAFTLHSYGRWHQTVAADWVGFRCAKN